MPMVEVERQLKQHARLNAPLVVRGQLQLQRKGVHRSKICAVVRVRQQIRIVAERILRIRAVNAVQPHGQLRRQAVYGQKLDQAAHAALPPKARRHLGRLRARDAGDLRQPRRLVFQHLKALRTKPLHDLRRSLRADALDRA